MKTRRFRTGLWLTVPLAVALMIGVYSCGEDKVTAPKKDTTAPAAIANLATDAITTTSVELTWTAPGDDGTTGKAHQYDIRYSTSAITADNFASATQGSGEPTPAAAGTSQTATVTGLTLNTPYYFAMKTADEVPNWSDISNVVQATTAETEDTTPPAAITDLSGTALGTTSVELTWTAPGDDGITGTAHEYDIRRSNSTITGANWASATPLTGEPDPTAAGSVQHMTINNLQAGHDYYFAMKTLDEFSNPSALSNVDMVHTPTTQTGPPELHAPAFPDTVCISSSDQYAQSAKLMVQLQLIMVKAYSQMATVFFAPLSSAQWQHSGSCWDYDYPVTGCTAHYNVCQSGSEYTYTFTLNGSCYSQSYSNWVAYRVVFDESARTGTFYAYDLNATTIEAAWVWTWAADENSGTYAFYDGDPATAPIQLTSEWAKSADENVYDVTWTVPDSERWVTHFVKTPCSGWAKSYQWNSDTSQWWLENDIVWNANGTGYWDIYDDTGTRQENHPW